jgi:hypothetical protein
MKPVHEGDDERIDLSPLDLGSDPVAFERHVRAVRAAAGGELARRQRPPALWDLIVRMRRPILAAAGVLAVVALPILLTPRASSTGSATVNAAATTSATSRTAIAEALGIPDAYAEWAARGTRPTPSDLLAPAEDSR